MWIGNFKGDVMLVEYFDYNCGYCCVSLLMIVWLVVKDLNVCVVFCELLILLL